MAGMVRVLVMALALVCGAASHADESQIVVVVSKDNPVDSMTRSQLIDLYMGRYVAFPDGRKAQPVDLSGDNALKEAFYQQLIGMPLARVNSYWSKIKFTGRAKPPVRLDTENDALVFLLEQKQGIAYVRRDSVNEDLKVIYSFDE